MHRAAGQRAIAILSGAGLLPVKIAEAVKSQGGRPVVVAIAGEADPVAFPEADLHVLHWGEVGRLTRLLDENGCREAVFAGTVAKRPDFGSLRPDLGALRLLPRILGLIGGGDDRVLRAVAELFAEHGVELVSPLDVAPQLGVEPGLLTGRAPGARSAEELALALHAARSLGALDVGQAAVAAGGRVVAVEGAEGTDALLQRVGELRRAGRIPAKGGVLVKCMKPTQDRRLDVPAIGAATAAGAKAAGLDGVGAEAGGAILVGRDETLAAFRQAGLFLMGLEAAAPAGDG
jgi:UDP-2,3-diacylglucosamine hydrolase